LPLPRMASEEVFRARVTGTKLKLRSDGIVVTHSSRARSLADVPSDVS